MLKNPKTGIIPVGIRQRELAFAKTLPSLNPGNALLKSNQEQGLSWSSRGPVNQGGRTRALAIDVANENNIWESIHPIDFSSCSAFILTIIIRSIQNIQ